MNILARNFGKLFFLALAGGLILGISMASRGMDVDLGTVRGVTLALTAPQRTPTSLVPAELFATPTPEPGAAPITVWGTVTQVNGATIAIASDKQTQWTASVSDSTVYVRTQAITAKDIRAGDALTTIGRGAADGSVEAEYLMVSSVAQDGIAGAALGATMITGRVQKVDGDVVTVEQKNGQAMRVLVLAATRLQRITPAGAADVLPGTPITVAGQYGDDGILKAVTVQIGPLG